jgi:CBS domain-containing protein
MKLMTQRRIRHLPVKKGDQLVGIISIGDVLKHRLDELELEANVMRDYAVAARR